MQRNSLISFKGFSESFNKQLKKAVLFGILSFLLGLIKFHIPGLQGGLSDMREIPLLISLFYLHSPWYLIISCSITAIGTPHDGSYISYFLMHLIPLIIGWYAYNKFGMMKIKQLPLVLLWACFTLIYYMVFMIPINLVIDRMIGFNNERSIWVIYLTIIPAVRFEIVYSGLISGLYLIQLNTRKSLEQHKINLEQLVESRTEKLAHANSELKTINQELSSTNKEIKKLNNNLDKIIKERTEKVQTQLDQLLKYAHMNSHQVRGPLSRMKGLLSLMLSEESNSEKIELLSELQISSNELDEIIIEMNRILETEVLP